MMVTLLVTLAVEGTVCAGYALGFGKPLGVMLMSCLAANLITQPLLWLILSIFLQHYLTALLATEVGIVGIEAAILYLVRPNRLRLGEALMLSLVMNSASFLVGLSLPV